MSRRVKRLETAYPNGHSPESLHPGAGAWSVQVGSGAMAEGSESTAIGENTYAGGIGSTAYGAASNATDLHSTTLGAYSTAGADHATAVGAQANASHSESTALGARAETTADNQVMLGTMFETVVVPGTFSNPSARRLKQSITPAPRLSTIFPESFEWEYIDGDGRRRIGPMADDLVGTDAERFVTFDADGQVAGINVLELLVAQNTVLHARITELETIVKGHHG